MKILDKFFRNKNVNDMANRRGYSSNSNEYGLLKSNLDKNISYIREAVGESSDVVFREFQVGEDGDYKMAVIFTDGLVDLSLIQDFILKILMLDIRKVNLESSVSTKKRFFKALNDVVIPSGGIKEISSFEELFNHLLSGDTIVLLDGYNQGYTVCSRGWEDRGVAEPNSQTVVRGPKDSFCETLRTNTALIRRKIKDKNLWIETKSIGRKTKTDVALVYMKGLADDKIVDEVRKRLDRIDIDGILEGGNIEEFIQDKTYTPFPTVYNTERPDGVAAGLLEGRVAIIIDGTPFVLLVPALFIHFLQSPEDYFQRFDISTFMRILRYLAFFIALLTPALYIAITTFHQEMIPTELLISIAAQREGVPFPALVEAFIMEITFEILREAGIRMPRSVGAAISIVGALVLGEAAVQAGIVSPVMVIVVSITAISSFVFPSYNLANSVRMLRFIFMILGASFGLYGITMGIIVMFLHLCSLRSYGLPYMAPLAPFNWEDQKDTIFRSPIWKRTSRPRLFSQENSDRQQNSESAEPKPPQ